MNMYFKYLKISNSGIQNLTQKYFIFDLQMHHSSNTNILLNILAKLKTNIHANFNLAVK